MKIEIRKLYCCLDEDGFWQENGDSITNGLKVAGNLLLRGLFGG